jgi:uncharacterized membrane protein
MHNHLQSKRSERIQKLAEEQKRALEEQQKREVIRERITAEHNRRIEERISLLGLLFGVPMLVMGFLGINLRGLTNTEGMSVLNALLLTFGSSLVLIGMLVGVLRLVKSSRSEIDHNKDA